MLAERVEEGIEILEEGIEIIPRSLTLGVSWGCRLLIPEACFGQGVTSEEG